jgi:hypothetical protein
MKSFRIAILNGGGNAKLFFSEPQWSQIEAPSIESTGDNHQIKQAINVNEFAQVSRWLFNLMLFIIDGRVFLTSYIVYCQQTCTQALRGFF